jgi:ATP-dependent Clp protease ATP-binding subunit ClpB
MLEGKKEKLLHMEEMLGKRVVGQAQAARAVSTAVRRARAGLQDPNRPIGSFMFLGRTGVGKTEVATALAEFLFEQDSLPDMILTGDARDGSQVKNSAGRGPYFQLQMPRGAEAKQFEPL